MAQSKLLRSCQASQLIYYRFLLGRLSPLNGKPVLVHILSPVSEISGSGMTLEIIS